MWSRYIPDVNETSVPETFKASNGAVRNHNSEVGTLEMQVTSLQAENERLLEALEEIKEKYLHGCMPADAMYQIAVKALKGAE